MAERVLPSCQEMMDDRPWIGDELEVVIVEAYAEGRLVDREAIDSICDEIWELGQASWPWRDALTPVLDAALEV